MLAGWAFLRRLGPFKNVPTVRAVPFNNCFLLENLTVGDVRDQLAVP